MFNSYLYSTVLFLRILIYYYPIFMYLCSAKHKTILDMNYKKNDITLYIKEVMKEKGIMSKTLQEALGMTQASVSYIINNKTNPSLDTLQRIAEILEVPIWRLFYKETPKELQPEQPSVPQSPTITCPHCGKPIEISVK